MCNWIFCFSSHPTATYKSLLNSGAGEVPGSTALPPLLGSRGQTVIVVDWKSKGGELTPAQQRLIARGFPVRFIQRPEQLDALKTELIRAA